MNQRTDSQKIPACLDFFATKTVRYRIKLGHRVSPHNKTIIRTQIVNTSKNHSMIT